MNNDATAIRIPYRQDIDGLRAIAVSLVVLSHCGLFFSGGYVGVDVFFVISGYLITGIIRSQYDTGSWSLSKFLFRRFMRLMPALVGMLLTVLVAGFFFLLPTDYETLGNSTLAQLFMVGNVYAWKTTGYFSQDATLQPLLHGWSLAVEEQFYLFFPILLIIATKKSQKTALSALVSFAFFSLALSEYGARFHPSAAYLLLPTRAWELLLGALLTFIPSRNKKSQIKYSLMAWLGLILILLASILFTEKTPFPGFAATLPCVGAAMIIHFDSVTNFSPNSLLCSKLFSLIGKMSYSIYLWHWPIISFWCYHSTVKPISRLDALTLLPLILAVSYVSWKYLEQPFRRINLSSAHQNRYQLAMLCGCLILGTTFIATTVSIYNGFDRRLSPFARKIAAAQLDKTLTANPADVKEGRLPKIGGHNNRNRSYDFIVWGDSHVLPLSNLFEKLANDTNTTGVVASMPGSVPAMQVWRDGRKTLEQQWNTSILEFIEEKDIKDVILVCHWSCRVGEMPNPRSFWLISGPNSVTTTPQEAKRALSAGLNYTLQRLTDAGRRVWIIGQMPFTTFDPKRESLMTEYFGYEEHRTNQDSRKIYQDSKESIRCLLNSIPAPFVYLDPGSAFFNTKKSVLLQKNGVGLWFDQDHLSTEGADFLLTDLLKPVKDQLNKENFLLSRATKRGSDSKLRQ